MNKKIIYGLYLAASLSLCGCGLQSDQQYDFGSGLFNNIETVDAEYKTVLSDSGTSLIVKTGFSGGSAGLVFNADVKTGWDLSDYACLKLRIKNLSDEKCTFWVNVSDSDEGGRKSGQVPGVITLAGGESGELKVDIYAYGKRLSNAVPIVGMRGVPVGAGRLNPERITKIHVYVKKPVRSYRFQIDQIKAAGVVQVLDAAEFFPFIDSLGQYKHSNWPGKTSSSADLIDNDSQEKEAKIEDWNIYGGWKDGPVLKSNGFFRVQKYQKKWWIIDPQGQLFFSHGANGVGNTAPTPVDKREHYFEWLPDTSGIFTECWDMGHWAPHGFYKDKKPFKTFDFARANLIRKYGPQWKKAFIANTAKRLKKERLNTMGNWSWSEMYAHGAPDKTPYVVSGSTGKAKVIEGSEGWWRKFPDPYDPSFRQSIRESLTEYIGNAAGDPWCIGFFVDNEQSWGDEINLARSVLISPAEQPAKRMLLIRLKAKYGSVKNLNQAWSSTYTDWEELLQGKNAPNIEISAIVNDLSEFSAQLGEQYFKICREEVKRIAPRQMYLGCRFSAEMMDNSALQILSEKYCDIITFNIYNRLPVGFTAALQKPVIIGEFHFGALDRGMFHTGLWAANNQEERAALYEDHVRYSLRHPLIVGVHWFKHSAQPTTGRPDEENFQIGFLDICDKPYRELEIAAQRVGKDMYRYRFEK